MDFDTKILFLDEVESEAADIVLHVNDLQLALFIVGCGGFVEFHAESFEVRTSAVGEVTADSDVAAFAAEGKMHHFKFCAREGCFGTNVGFEAEELAELISKLCK